MRFHHLNLTAFGPFSETITVDFDQLNTAGLFLLHGATGAGKTSLLDAICFALYGSIPGARHGARRLKSDHSAPEVEPVVELTFTASGRTFTIRRSPDWLRPKRRGAGTTKVPHKVSLAEHRAGEVVPLSSRVDESAQLLQAALGLTMAQFTRVVLLPQGEFANFLHAKDEDRKALLENLFGTHRFTALTTWLRDQRRAQQHEVAECTQAVQQVLAAAEQAWQQALAVRSDDLSQDECAGVPDAALSSAVPGSAVTSNEVPDSVEPVVQLKSWQRQVNQWLQEATEKVHATATVKDAAYQAYEAAQDFSKLWLQYRDNAIELAHNQAVADQMETLRADVKDGLAAAPLADGYRRVQGATVTLTQAQNQVKHALAQWQAVPESALSWRPDTAATVPSATPAAGDVADWATLHDQAQHAVAAAQALVHLDQDAQHAHQAQLTAAAELATARTAQAQNTTAVQNVQVAVQEAEDQLSDLPDVAVELDRVRRELDTAETAVAAATLAADQAVALDEAQSTAASAQDAADAAKSAAEAATAARIASLGAELASELVPGEPCAVCGATEHPAPAVTTVDHVSAAAQQNAQKLADTLAEKARAAALAYQVADQAHAQAQKEAGGATIAEATATLCAVRDRLTQLVDQDRSRTSWQAALKNHQDGLARCQENHLVTEAAVAAAMATHKSAEQQVTTAVEKQRAAATPCATVAEKVQAISASAALLADVHQAVTICAQQEKLVTEVSEHFTAQVIAAGFVDVPAALAAAMPPETLAAHQTTLTTYDQHRHHLAEQAQVLAERLTTAPAWSEWAETEAFSAADLPTQPAVITTLCDQVQQSAMVAHQRWQETQTQWAHASEQAAVLAAAETSLVAHNKLMAAADAELGSNRRAFAELAQLALCAEGTGGGNTLNMSLSAFILAARLEQVTEAASTRLQEMSDGRYTVQHTDALARGARRAGLGIEVHDLWTGAQRPPATLSGGETFLTSLALALGLADVVSAESGGTTLDTLFVDEGFGSLDPETLSDVLDTLDQLRDGGRTVGLISHVTEMKQRIRHGLLIQKTKSGSTVAPLGVVNPD